VAEAAADETTDEAIEAAGAAEEEAAEELEAAPGAG
jgi:hypothetical protein